MAVRIKCNLTNMNRENRKSGLVIPATPDGSSPGLIQGDTYSSQNETNSSQTSSQNETCSSQNETRSSHTKKQLKKETRSSTYHFIFGTFLADLKNDKLPTRIDVIRFYLFLKKDKPKKSDAPKVIYQLVDRLKEIWKLML